MTTIQLNLDIKSEILLPEEIDRLQRIEEKQDSPIYEIAFCGHFSAGKSSILNELIGENILPVSPIPTSANIIRIHKGELALEVKMSEDETKRIFKDEIPWNRVREWGRNGRDIEYLKVSVPLPWLSNSAVISDTPGVDSTDPTHSDVTVDQLYTTDMVVYVMDYNHVQSETNLRFLKQLTDERKPVMIIINQIDKHSENELSLDAFKSSVRNTFLSWKIRFQDIYLLSMKQIEHRFNEWDRFQKEIKSLLFYNEDLINDASKRLSIGFYERVRKRISEDLEYVSEEYSDKLETLDASPKDMDNFKKLKESYDQSVDFTNTLQEHYQRKQGKLFDNIVLFPHKIRELTKDWLEKENKNSRPGLWFIQKKKQEEKAKRTNVLLTELNDQIKSQLAFHVKKYFMEEADLHYVDDTDAFLQKVSQITIQADEELLQSFRKKGPVSDMYIFQYTDQVTHYLIKEWKKQSENLLTELQERSQMNHQEHIEHLHNQLQTYKHLKPLYEEIQAHTKTNYDHLKKIHQVLEELKSPTDYYRLIDTIKMRSIDDELNKEKLNLIQEEDSAEIESHDTKYEELTYSDFDENHANKRIDQIIKMINHQVPSRFLYEERSRIHDQIQRHVNQEFIVSLFGAFSSGKSSFANALLGHNVLPVSPQPATASISEIRRSDALHKHGSIIVKFKTKSQLQEELLEAGKLLQETLTIEGLKKWDASQKSQSRSIHKSTLDYVSIIQTGLRINQEMLGKVLTGTIDDLEVYAADEQTACLVEHLSIYYDCALTEEGITLIDTPGVNSVHSRHTQTALKQLNQSDAIFFLTYYNHAFSKADKHFIDQISQINETYSEDKLFFIINASDLAENQRELSDVIHHVKEELRQSGVQTPRISSVSSKEGLLAKQQSTIEKHGFHHFERKFYKQMIFRLKRLSYQHVESLFSRYLSRAKEWDELLQSDTEELTRYRNQIIHSTQLALQTIDQSEFHSVSGYAYQELDELVLFFRQRMTYHVTDIFGEHINVATLNADSKKELKKQFSETMQGYLFNVEQYANREMTTLRIRLENKVNDNIQNWSEELSSRLRKWFPYLVHSHADDLIQLQESYRAYTLTDNQPDFTDQVQSKKDLFVNQTVKEIKQEIIAYIEESLILYLQEWQNFTGLILEDELLRIEKEIKQSIKRQAEKDNVRLEQLNDPEELKVLKTEISNLQNLD